MPKDLLALAKTGDKDAFGQLVLPYERLLYNIAYKYIGNPDDAKDIAQEALIKIYLNIKSCGSLEAFKSWSAKITVNTALDALRKRARGKEDALDEHKAPESDEPENAALHNEEVKRVRDAINGLDEEHRALIILRDLEGFSYRELVGATGLPMGTVKSRLSRARLALREQIRKGLRHRI